MTREINSFYKILELGLKNLIISTILLKYRISTVTAAHEALETTKKLYIDYLENRNATQRLE